MARGGVNKAVVQQARIALLARGEHPSIDAIRIELGNTGSKTTIHRYLKELDSQQPAGVSGTPSLSEQLGSLVEQLAAQLHEEGQECIHEAEAVFAAERVQLESQLHLAQQALAAAHQQLQVQASALAAESEKLTETQTSLQAEQLRNATLSQSLSDSHIRLADKDEQVRSLEEKHQHARDALEHYRAASREQREQEQRRHEAQVQQLQVELRQLQQGMVIKQDELTRLHRDNERLVVEARQREREQRKLQDQLDQRVLEAQALTAALAQAQGAREELLRQVIHSREQLETERVAHARQERERGQLEDELAACHLKLADCEARSEQSSANSAEHPS